ncbi:MAG: zinc-dependent metalloprotease [Verrucomicrobiae bacterium]|nr:zinc-dependent metalloprotease [Verrucomicrobiae bacterium]
MSLRKKSLMTLFCLTAAGAASGQDSPGGPPKPSAEPDYPPLAKVIEGYSQLSSKSESGQTFYNVWKKGSDQLLAELPKDFRTAKQFIAMTVASGEAYAGLQSGEKYVYWKQYGKNKLALVEPNLEIRSTGDKESKSSIKRLFTDRVLLEVPIVTWVPKGGPVIDLDAFLVNGAPGFFGSSASGINRGMFEVKTAKVFQDNVEIGIEAPTGNGQLREFHYSISRIPEAEKSGYKPRNADPRIGYFTTHYSDFGKFEDGKGVTRFINRWNLEKADPKLKVSPPKNPIKFYVEHTTPIRYRRWVKDGIQLWNKAFENVGIVGAIEVYFQDAESGAHMEKDPEDVNYNFVRWLSNGVGTAIGPSRVHPETGQILDADIILTDGWIRHWWQQYNEVMPEVAIEGYAPQTLAWLHKNPEWDPRVRLAPPSRRQEVFEQSMTSPIPALGGHAVASVDTSVIGDQEYDGLMGRFSQVNGLCMAANCKSHGIAMMQMALDIATANDATEGDEGKDGEKKDEEKKDEKDKEQMVDGIPESFIGPLLIDLVAHEVGHTLGLRHNFKGSSIYTYEEINSDAVKGKKPFAGSVMDYIPINIVAVKDAAKGDYGMIDLGPYDMWAIEYGYSFESDLKPILSRVAEPELQYATDEDTWGPDPLARRYDFGKDPLAYANNQIELAREHRANLIEKFVKNGDSWSKARRGYELTLRTQLNALSMMANWIGGTYVYRDFKGDPNGRAPVEVVPAEKQRAALKFVVDNAFRDEAFGLTPEMIQYLTVDKWWDDMDSAFADPGWPVHDRILGIQASALTALLNPTVLGYVYDNEFRVPSDQDALTLPEVLETIHSTIWAGLEKKDDTIHTARKPFFSSLQRNLQREHVDRLIDLTEPEVASMYPAFRPISDLATDQLTSIKSAIEPVLAKGGLDSYSRSHLRETAKRIEKALNADYVIQK